LAAAAGNAPALPVSETGVQTSTLRGKSDGLVEPVFGLRPPEPDRGFSRGRSRKTSVLQAIPSQAKIFNGRTIQLLIFAVHIFNMK
jgi:hypothetical protein